MLMNVSICFDNNQIFEKPKDSKYFPPVRLQSDNGGLHAACRNASRYYRFSDLPHNEQNGAMCLWHMFSAVSFS